MRLFRRLFSRSVSSQIEIPVIHTEDEFRQLCARETGVLFKHSPTCFASMAAHRRVKVFAEGHPGIPISMVSVIAQREFSRSIAARTRVRHESPQVIVLRFGQVIAHMSHDQITAERLEQLTQAPTAAVGPA